MKEISEKYSNLDFLQYGDLFQGDDDSYAASDTTKVCSTVSSNADSNKDTISTRSSDDDLLLLATSIKKSDKFYRDFSKYSHLLESNAQKGICAPLIQNVVASVHLGRELDLREIAISTRNAEYNPKKFNALVLRMQNPRCTGLVFRTGRIIITGSKTMEETRLGAKRIAKIIRRELGGEFMFTNFKVENIIATFNCNVPIRLEVFSQEHKELCNYEPEFFAGLVYRCPISDGSEAVLLVFVSGNVIVTGCKSASDIQYVFKTMCPILQQYKQ